MIFLFQAGLYDILKKEPTRVVNDFTVEYKDNVFVTLRLNDYILNDVINKYPKEEALRIVSGGILSSQLNNLNINYMIDYPCFATHELRDEINYMKGELINSIFNYSYYSGDKEERKLYENKILLFQKEFNLKDEVIIKQLKKIEKHVYVSLRECIETFSLHVDESLYEDVLNILENNKFEYIDNFKRENTFTGNIGKKEYVRKKESNYNDLERNLYETIINIMEYKRIKGNLLEYN